MKKQSKRKRSDVPDKRLATFKDYLASGGALAVRAAKRPLLSSAFTSH